MNIANISLYLINQSELEMYLQRQQTYLAIYKELEASHRVVHVHLCGPGLEPPPDFRNNRFFRTTCGFSGAALLFVRSFQPDLVFFHSIGFPVRALAFRSVFKNHTRIIVHNHAEQPAHHPAKRWLQRLAYRSANTFLFSGSELAQNFIAAGIIREPSAVREVMELSTTMRPENKEQSRTRLAFGSECVFLWVGRLNANKDPLTLLRALTPLRDSNWKLYMIYSENDMEQEIKDYLHHHGLEQKIILKGSVPNTTLATWYSAADYYVSASHYEGSGLALCEAMACDLAPVVTSIPSFRFMTKKGACAYLYPPGDHHRLSEILRRLVDGSGEPLPETPRQVFSEKLSYEAISRQIAEIANFP